MKKFLVLMTLFTAMCPAMQTYAMLGDADMDDSITAADAALTLQYSLNSDIALTNSKIDVDAMVVTKNDYIGADSAATILQKSLNLDYRFPVTYIQLDSDGLASLRRVILQLYNQAIPNSDGIDKQILTLVCNEMIEYKNDNNYDIQNGIAKAKTLVSTLSSSERQELKSYILLYCDANDLMELNEFFGFLVH